MICDQWRNSVWQWSPEKLEENGLLCGTIRMVTLFMLPRRGRIPLTPKMIEAAMMNLVTAKIRHISLLLTEETMQRKVSQSCFLIGFSQDSIFSLFMLFNSTSRNLYPRFWSTWVPEHKQMMMMGNIGHDFVLDLPHIRIPFFLVQITQEVYHKLSLLKNGYNVFLSLFANRASSTKIAEDPIILAKGSCVKAKLLGNPQHSR